MTDKQENMYSMYVVLYGFLTNRMAVVLTIPAFKRAYDRLGAVIEQIKEVDSGRQTITSGKSDIKAKKKSELIEAIYNAASALYTYADETGKPDILNRVDKGESYYKRMRDSNLVLEAKNIVKLTVGIETELAEHGLSAEEIAHASSLAAEFEAAMKEMGTSEADGSTATKSVYQLIGDAKDLIDNQLSVHAAKFRTKNPEFYNGYSAVCKVINSGVRHDKKEEESTMQNAAETAPAK